MATQKDALAWLNGGWKKSKYVKDIPAAGGLGIDYDGKYGFQCMDFFAAFGADLGAPVRNGNAITVASGEPGWSFVSSPAPGDWCVRHYVSGGVDYGDVVGVLAGSGSNIKTIGQNQKNPSLEIGHVPTTEWHPKTAFFRYIRLNYKEDKMVTNREDAIWLYRVTMGIHSPTEKQKQGWTGRDLSQLLQEIQKDHRYLKFIGKE